MLGSDELTNLGYTMMKTESSDLVQVYSISTLFVCSRKRIEVGGVKAERLRPES
jgi:hypothetical protein